MRAVDRGRGRPALRVPFRKILPDSVNSTPKPRVPPCARTSTCVAPSPAGLPFSSISSSSLGDPCRTMPDAYAASAAFVVPSDGRAPRELTPGTNGQSPFHLGFHPVLRLPFFPCLNGAGGPGRIHNRSNADSAPSKREAAVFVLVSFAWARVTRR